MRGPMKYLASLIIIVAIATAADAQPGADPGQPQPPPPQEAQPPPQPTATPGVCVTIDPQRDTLADNDRTAARSLLLGAFEAERLRTDPTNTACSETYT